MAYEDFEDVNKLSYAETMRRIEAGTVKLSVNRAKVLVAVMSEARLSRIGILAIIFSCVCTGLGLLLALLGYWRFALISCLLAMCGVWLFRSEAIRRIANIAIRSERTFLLMRHEGLIEIVNCDPVGV